MDAAISLEELDIASVAEESLRLDPEESAEAAGLVYVTDGLPGIRREKKGEGFAYFSESGEQIEDEKTLRRIKSLVIPPAWTDVWISPIDNSHLQATGRDAKGRKQFRYHKRWAEVRGETKFSRMLLFGVALSEIRKRVEKDLSLRGLKRERVLATVVRLLETSLIRIGNKEYEKENHSFGLTTLRSEHVEVSGSILRFNFRGKSGKRHQVQVADRRLAKIIRRCEELPGQELFQYVDDEGEARTIGSGDVNAYLLEITGDRFTAKDFRTWGGTMHAARALVDCGPAASASQVKKNIVQAVKHASSSIGNKEAVCRKYYVHPAIFEAYEDGRLLKAFEKTGAWDGAAGAEGLRPDEIAVLKVLGEWAASSK